MKICLLSDSYPPNIIGGAGRVVYLLAQGLNKRGHKVVIITTSQSEVKRKKSIESGIIVYRLYNSYPSILRHYISLANPLTLLRINSILRLEKPQVIHAHNIHQHLSYASLLIARNHSSDVLFTAHDTMSYTYGKQFKPFSVASSKDSIKYKISWLEQWRSQLLSYNPLRNTTIKKILGTCKEVVAVSRCLAKALSQNSIPVSKVIHNGMDLHPKLEINTPQISNKISSKTKIILLAGRIHPLKGASLALKYLKSINLENVLLVFAGAINNHTKVLKREAHRLGIANRIVFTGWLKQPELQWWYQRCSVVITPSIYLDPFNLTNLEAMLQKKPVVGSCFGGIPEIVQDRVTGYIRDPRDIKVYAKAINTLLNSPKLSLKMGRAGFARANNLFTLEKQITAYEKLYKQ